MVDHCYFIANNKNPLISVVFEQAFTAVFIPCLNTKSLLFTC